MQCCTFSILSNFSRIGLYSMESSSLCRRRAFCSSCQAETLSDVTPNLSFNTRLELLYACAPESADQEFVLARNQYLMNAGNGKKNEVIAYQLRQSFKPGEVSAEEANQIGYKLAERLLHGEHAFIVATHTDRKHMAFILFARAETRR